MNQAGSRNADAGVPARWRCPEVELPTEDGVREIPIDDVVERVDEPIDRVAERWIVSSAQDRLAINAIGCIGGRDLRRSFNTDRPRRVVWVQTGLGEVAQQIWLKDNHDWPAVLRFLACKVEHEVKILPVGGHVVSIKEMFTIGPIGLAPVGNVVPDETRNHAELLAVANVLADPSAFFGRPGSPAIDWAAVDIDVANINPAVQIAIAKVSEERKMRTNIFAHTSDCQIVRKPRHAAISISHGDAHENPLTTAGVVDPDGCKPRRLGVEHKLAAVNRHIKNVWIVRLGGEGGVVG